MPLRDESIVTAYVNGGLMMDFIRRLKFILQVGVDAIVALGVTIAGKLEALLGFLFTGGVAIAGLLFVVWWLLPDDWQIKYAAEYMLLNDQVIIEHKPHNCEWASAPLGNKHCHYEKVVTVFNRDNKIIKGPAPTNPAPADQTPAKVYVSWERVED
jgi:hypothetical protein